MSFFGSFSDIIASLSPRRQQPADRQLQHRQPSHRSNPPSTRRSPSPTPAGPRRRINSVRHQLSLNSDLADNHHSPPHIRFSPHSIRDQDIDVSEQTPPPSKYTLRLSGRHLLISLTAYRSGDTPQMLNQDSKRNGAQEEDRKAEARLLGSGARIKDKNAVKIKPGASMQHKKKVPGKLFETDNVGCQSDVAFRPQDLISRNSRESGPVRAQGKARQPVPNKNLPHLEDAFEPSSRPIKRRRQDGNSDFSDNKGVNDPLSPPTNSLSRLSPESSQFSTKSKNHAHPYRQGEYREVENSVRVSNKSPRARRQQNRQISTSTQSPDDTFTAQAAQQRPSIAVIMESPNAKPGTKGLARSVLDAVEFFSTRKLGLNRRSDSESSDELQGEVTTQPVPTNIDERQNQARLPTKEHSVSPDRSSPTDIVPTKFAGSNKKAKRKHKIPDVVRLRLDIRYLQFGREATKSGVDGRSIAIYIDHEKIESEGDILGTGVPVSLELRKVVRIFHGEDPSRKLSLFLSKGASELGEILDIEFWNNQSKNQLMDVLRDKEIARYAKEPDFMDRAFQNHKLLAQNHQHPKRSLPEPDSTSPPANLSARQKISSALQGSVDEPGSKRVKRDISSIAKTGNGITESRAPENGRKPDPNAGVEIPVKPFRATQAPPARETRSTGRTWRNTDDSIDSLPSHLNRPVQAKDENREKWKKPMVYPRIGKRRAEVSVEDRDRLREDEFLNDNLIGFYLRFLEDHLERTKKDVAERIYFFNSYFFATLKKGRGINYSSVEKWTRNIDLFSYDYVVVPINEDAHWYVAIICNLPSLDVASAGPVEQSSAPVSDKEFSAQPESEVQEIPESPEPEPVPAATTTTAGAQCDQDDTEEKPMGIAESQTPQEAWKSTASATIVEEGKPAATEEVETPTQGSKEKKQDNSSPGSWPDGAENLASPPPKLSGMHWDRTDPTSAANQSDLKTKKKGRNGPKLHPSQTTIVTFDSLNLSRSPTIKYLREYICEEALSKRGVEVDPKEIKGMRARQIPLQPNFVDCGLYLLAYIEKFVQDPDNFITRILQRGMDEHADWPPLASGLLRHRLRKFLDDMYEEQKKQDGRSVMANQPRISFLLGPPLPSQEDDEKDKKEERRSANPFRSETPKTDQENCINGTNENSAADEPQLVPIAPVHWTVSEDQPEQPADMDAIKSPAKPSTSSDDTGRDILEVPDSQEPKTSCEGKKKPTSEDASVRRKEKRKAAHIPTKNDVVDVGGTKPEKDHISVEIQVEATPEPERPKK
ncbi:hypothetical protein N7486_002659, partial [Penicillium sp. IBT 16267x]